MPGAGKTLVGLNVATRRRSFGEARAVFLSGYGPLVAVLQEALTRDEYTRLHGAERKEVIRQKVKPFIQNVHHFRDEGVRSEAPPYDHVVIFDEAQRAWNREKTADFMKRKKGQPGFMQSESEFLISYLDRHDSWAVIVCLVGGGQEIHTGEAGIGAWVRTHARGSEQFGLIASSQAMRLKPHAIDVRVAVDPIHWFLGDPSDTRSSYYLEDAATEFQVQGLEVDWACITWDADLRHVNGCWRYHSFRGDQWTNVQKEDRQRYLLNAYRVLLTRARQGMAIFVPPGDRQDPTRVPQFYDGTFEYLRSVGIPEF